MPSAKEALDRLRWHPDFSISDVMIWYEDRMSETGVACLKGADVGFFESSFFGVEEASIPYHRVFRIEHRGLAVFERPRRQGSQSRRGRARPGRRT
ncbi:MAG: DUF504 domain-containing protein [Euryarchaeota archaeon]|nr:DUF504 domain-containing protein [Euryarchaeota archaeon]